MPDELLDGDRHKRELFTSVAELASGACESAGAAAAEIAELRRSTVRTAAPRGLRLAASGTQPLAAPLEQEARCDSDMRPSSSTRRPAACAPCPS